MAEHPHDEVRHRRTQHERRSTTVAKILDATVTLLGDVGYAKTTIARVCEVSGVSQGGLARHFPRRLDLMLATADLVARSHLTTFRARADREGVSTLELLRLLRGSTRSPLNKAWYELFSAARTDELLRAEMAPLAQRLHREVLEFARDLPGAQELPAAIRDTMLFTVIHLFDGEAMSAVLAPHPEQEELRLHLIAGIFEAAAEYPQLMVVPECEAQ